MSVSVFGVCSDLGSDRFGTSKGARLLLPENSKFLCTEPNSRLIKGYPLKHDIDALLQVQHNEVETHIQNILKMKDKPFMVGGDHSFSYPILKTLLNHYPTIHLLHFDWHTDDCYSRKALAEQKYKTPRHGTFLWLLKYQYSRKLKVTYVGATPELSLYGKLAAKPKDIYIKDGEFIYVSIDVDCLTAEEMTSTGYPHEPGDGGGLHCTDILEFLTTLKKREKITIVGGDVVEFGCLDEKPDDLLRAQSLVSAVNALLM